MTQQRILEIHPPQIHHSAIVEPGAQLGPGVVVGPFSHVGSQVTLDEGVILDSHVSITGRTQIGRGTRVWPFATLGAQPQDLKYRGEDTSLVVGAENMIREYVNISIGTVSGGSKTVVGRGNLLMMGCHIGHDCQIGDDCILANGVSLGGHVEVGDRAVLGGHSGVHQFVKIGPVAMLAGGAMVAQDVPPYCTVAGNRAVPNGLNTVGLRRAGVASSELATIKEMYRLVYQASLSLGEALAALEERLPPSSFRDVFTQFLRSSQRGICR